jgi:NAD(P)-dependent dehydrogenase (short-subunit alcohol dehydrogenase family)
MPRLSNKVVLVTGGARGLGRSIAERCAAEGAALVLIDVLEEEGRRAAAELNAQGAQTLFERCDITRYDELLAVMERIRIRWKRLDGLVNNAALATQLAGRSFDQIDEASWDRVMQINVKGTWLVTKAAVPLLKAAKPGRVVNMASDTALWGADLFLHYIASKGAIIAMTRGMARELGPHEVTVNTVAPGLTPTEATAGVSERRWQQYRGAQMLKRDPVAQDVASVVTFLLTDDAAFMTGQTLAVNGGMTSL